MLLWKHFVWALVLIHARGSISVGTTAPETGPQVQELGSPVWGGPGTHSQLQSVLTQEPVERQFQEEIVKITLAP